MIRKLLNIILVASLLLNLVACAGNHAEFDSNHPDAGYSVQIAMQNGRIYEGLLLRVSAADYQLIDSQQHKLLKLKKTEVRRVEKSSKEYDFEGNLITPADAADARGLSRTLGYGIGGLVLGAGAGFGIGVVLAATATVPFLYPIAAFGLAGSWYFGKMGMARDAEMAVDNVRADRLTLQKQALQDKIDAAKKQLELKKQQLKKKNQDKSGN